MKKIGIITCYDMNNYGNRLQNYASQEMIRKLGCEPCSFVEKSKTLKTDRLAPLKYMIHRLTGYRFTGGKEYWMQYPLIKARRNAFARFQFGIKTVYIDGWDLLKNKADYFVAGSDQIWQPKWWRYHDREMYLLSFARPEQKICLSPSFGVSQLEDEYKDLFREELSSFAALSSRESAGAAIIEELTGRKAQVTIDPTLMLDAEEWKRVEAKPRCNLATPYVVTYFLGKKPEQAMMDIQKLQNDHPDMKVYHLNDKSDVALYSCGPAEFLYLIDHAAMVLTDSFHASVFSFVFERPFMVYAREESANVPSMLSRISTLLSTFDMDRKYRNSGLPNEWYECDYSNGKKKLEEERKKLNNLLKEAFRMPKE